MAREKMPQNMVDFFKRVLGEDRYEQVKDNTEALTKALELLGVDYKGLKGPSKKAAGEDLVDDLMERVESLVNEGEIAELRHLVADLGELITAVNSLISQMQAKKAYGQKANIKEVLGQIKEKIEKRRAAKRSQVPGVIEDIAARIQG